MKYLSLFSGIGGFELGIQKAVPDAYAIGFSEIDKYARSIYQKHFPEHKDYGDARDIVPEQLPDFDLLVAGFPCQSFSIAGKRKGFGDVRGTLFFEIARVLRDKRPRHILLENVQGLLSHEAGKTFQTMLRVLADLGYDVQWQVLNSKYFSVPQNRPRVFIVGYTGKGRGRQVFPLGQGDAVHTEKDRDSEKEQQRVRCEHISTAVTKNYHKGVHCGGETYIGTLRNRPGEKPFRPVKGMVSPALNARARQDGDMQPVVLRNGQLRRLTPIECERLQGFPDNWTSCGQNGEKISDTQRYKCIGNAVTVNVIEAIIKQIEGG